MKKCYFFLCLLTFCACRKDSETTTLRESDHIPKVFLIEDFEQIENPVTASVFGKVINHNGFPVPDALVRIGTETLLTDSEGSFLFREKTMNAAGTLVTVKKESVFFAGSARFFPKEESENYLTIRLLPKQLVGTSRSDEKLSLQIDEHTKVIVEANSLMLPNGEIYDGEVFSYSHSIRPERKNIVELLPGNYQGIDRKNQEVALSGYGAIALELLSENGEKLELDREKKAQLSFSISEAYLATAPDKVPFWFFNEEYGLWQDQGDFYLEGDKYIGEITHLDFLQLAASSPMAMLSGRLISDTEQPVPNILVKISDEHLLLSSYAYTDNEGFFNCPVPADNSIKLSAQTSGSDCQILDRTEEAFASDKDLGSIVIPETNSFVLTSISGTFVNCADENINDLFVEVLAGSQEYCYYNLSGNQINLSVPNCNPDEALTVSVRDMNDLHESGELLADLGSDLELGETLLCGDGEADYIAIKFPGSDALFFYNPELGIDTGNGITRITSFEDTLEQIDISFTGLTTGTYMDSDINFFKGAFPTTGSAISIDCDTSCGFDQLVVEEYGMQPGERISGNFSGGSVFLLVLGTGNGGVQVPFEGAFSVTIQ